MSISGPAIHAAVQHSAAMSSAAIQAVAIDHAAVLNAPVVSLALDLGLILLVPIVAILTMAFAMKRTIDFCHRSFGMSLAHGPTVVMGGLFGISVLWMAIAGATVLGSLLPGSPRDSAIHVIASLLVALLGGVAGGVAGMLVSPFGKADAQRFGSVMKAGSAFATGYLVTKFDTLFDHFVSGKTTFDPTVIAIALACLIAAVGAFVMIFVPRLYGRRSAEVVELELPLPPPPAAKNATSGPSHGDSISQSGKEATMSAP
ncbi:hypothetical protein [Novosphingobium lentum]|uniref:hypothetical protein n=1 Tax=Novosphingobium lentum TaxID=145287 RepID=UPI00082BC717|nr:hypothetical protein [Novosphingobium lentum]